MFKITSFKKLTFSKYIFHKILYSISNSCEFMDKKCNFAPVWKRILWLHQNGFLSISTCTVYLKFSMAKKSRYYCYQKQQMFLFGSSCCASRHFILHASKTFSGKNPLQKLQNEFVFPTLILISVQLFYISIVEM